MKRKKDKKLRPGSPTLKSVHSEKMQNRGGELIKGRQPLKTKVKHCSRNLE
jgi:hypothetical protein